MAINIKGQAAIVGIGATEFFRTSPHSPTKLAGWALKSALADAGAARDEVDGVAIHTGPPMGVDYDSLVPDLGLNVRHVVQYWTHGRFVTTALQNAALAVISGLADVVAVFTVIKRASLLGGTIPTADRVSDVFDAENDREGGGPHLQAPAFGFVGAQTGIALATRKYFSKYDLDDDSLLPVVRSSRAHAARNPRALRRGGFDAEAYLAEPMVMDPIRASDGIVMNDVAIVTLVASAERAQSYAKPPVYLRGMQGMRTGREEFLLGPRGIGIAQQGISSPAAYEHRPRQVFEMAGLQPPDIDAFYGYDIYSPLVLFMLERFGHCAPGAASRFAADGHINPGGKLPVNTSGGMLSEGYACGWNNITEIVRQVRGQAGPTQLTKAHNLQWGTAWGDSIIFGDEP